MVRVHRVVSGGAGGEEGLAAEPLVGQQGPVATDFGSSGGVPGHDVQQRRPRLCAPPGLQLSFVAVGCLAGAGHVPWLPSPAVRGPLPKPLRPRQLQEVGRQGSSDSGIATGSHSSYSGSFSSCAGSSLDVWRAGDEFGSLLSLPPAAGVPEPSLCTCPPGTAEYQVPTALRHHYDTPRSLRQAPRDQTLAAQGGPDDGGAGDSGGQMSAGCPSGWLGARRRGQATEAPGCEAPGEGWEAGSPHAGPPPAFFSTCPVCGGLKGAAASAPGLLMMHSGAPGPERPCSEAPPYVNIPVSPSSKTQLHYMGLELQGASAGIRGAGASRYAQIDITATEAAHRVGAQHAQSREERLPELERRRKGALR
ncbi:protein Dok-7 [Leptonychotes weddellii]|uniref:Protein Dok-7 n=1 Tax=Leptonychotes weddellii TaxID=9713 RepID=A0A2U3Y8Z0_LEPWE|nr:protein Dok-7 [Leptonychotes weddellii]